LQPNVVCFFLFLFGVLPPHHRIQLSALNPTRTSWRSGLRSRFTSLLCCSSRCSRCCSPLSKHRR
jgi:hypothetical protein